MPESQNPESPNLPNTSKARTRKKRSKPAKPESDYPSFRRQDAQRVAGAKNTRSLSQRGMALRRLGLSESDIEGVPSITKRVVSAVGSTEEAIELLAGDDSPDSIKFTQKCTPAVMTDLNRRWLHLEDVIVAAGLTTRRFIELIAGANSDHSDFIFRTLANQKRHRVLESTIKAATDEIPIMDKEGEVIGATNGDVKAMELFFKLTKDIQPSGITLNSNNQTANLNVAPERDPLQSMDSFLLEIENVRKPKQLNAPVDHPMIPVEMPENAPEIEYLGIDE